jgi:hypothetical protein
MDDGFLIRPRRVPADALRNVYQTAANIGLLRVVVSLPALDEIKATYNESRPRSPLRGLQVT